MSELYLIAHKVRGEPAFDIAQRIEVEGEFWWIIPTSGHRAHPYWEYLLNDIIFDLTSNWGIPPMPPNLPDHYACNDRPSPEPTGFKIDLRALGLSKPKPPIMRRV